MAINLPWHPLKPSKTHLRFHNPTPTPTTSTTQVLVQPIRSRVVYVQAFRRSDFDGFARRVTSGDAWRDVWRTANDGFEQLLYESKKTAERINRRYDVSRRLSAAAQSAADRAREIDRDFELTQRWRNFSLDFSRNWPRYRKQIGDFADTPLGKSAATVFFLWFFLSGWLFRILIFSAWVLPFAGPLLIGAVANNLVIKGECPACRREFIGSKSQTVRCAGCGNIVWQPKDKSDFFSRGGRGTSSSKSKQEIIDVEFEEK